MTPKDFITKYHTYLLAAVGAGIALYQALSGTAVPPFVYDALGAVGLTSMRVSITTATGVSGWKTYALAVGLALIAGLRAVGVVVPPMVEGVLVSLAGGATVAAVNKGSN